MIAGYEIHPAAQAFPLLGEAELDALAADIKARGLLEPITLLDGLLVDGRNRALACKRAGVKPTTVEWSGTGSVIDWIVSKNLRRRHLDESQRAMVGARLEPVYAAEAKERQRAAGHKAGVVPANLPEAVKGEARERAAAQVNVSPRSVQAAKRVLQHAAPELREAVDAGRIAVSAAAQLVDEPAALQATIAERVAAGQSVHSAVSAVRHSEAQATIAAQAQAAPERACITNARAENWLLTVRDGSVDLLLTDPPYSTDIPDLPAFISRWLPAALRKVKPTGRAYICTGAYPDELAAYLTALRAQTRLTLANVLVWTYRNTLGPSPRLDYKANWQAVFYLRGADAGPLDCPLMLEQFSVQDIAAPDGRQGNRFHEWQKPDELAERFIRHATKPGDLVVDPFAGTGTFLLAAARLGRHASGCDCDPRAIAIAEKRGASVQQEAA